MAAPIAVRLEVAAAGDAELHVHELSGRAALSQLYEYRVDFWCAASQPLSVDALVGADAVLVYEIDGTEVRRVHGLLRVVDELFRPEARDRAYRALLVPHAHVLELFETLDVFTGSLTVPQLVSRKLEQGEVTHDAARLVGAYPERDFYMQYRESDWGFVCRRLEHVGIGFYFAQDGGDKLVLFDDSSTLPEGGSHSLTSHVGELGVSALTASTQTVPSLHAVMDYNEDTPEVDLTCSSDSPSGLTGGIVEYGPFFRTVAEGDALARARREERECRRRVWRGEANVCTLWAGQRIVIEGLEQDAPLLIEAIEEHATIARMQGGKEAESTYRVSFTALDAGRPYRPERRTAVPRVEGLVSALVEPEEYGAVGSYAKLDPQGRYMVKFRFDSADLDGMASCPVRLIQPSAGPDYGMHFPLKPGVEVAVGFVNGDPDRPVIVGSLHNAAAPAVVRDQNATFSMIKTRTGVTLKMKDA